MKKFFEKQDKILKSNKAYDNFEFIHSTEGRTMRLLAEYIYPEQYLRKRGVKGSVVFYGSARTLSREKFDIKIKELKEKLRISENEEKENIQIEINNLLANEDMTNYYEDGVRLSQMLGKWLGENVFTKGIFITSGGGGGMMEAANKGASLANLDNIGFNISLPFEQHPNKYITNDLNFEFHYFFMRKFWFVYLAKAIVVLPGGFGTFDELMEILTLKQTHKVTKPLPIILYGSEFWKNAVNIEYLYKKHLISKEDFDLFKYFDTPEDAFEYLKTELTNSLKK